MFKMNSEARQEQTVRVHKAKERLKAVCEGDNIDVAFAMRPLHEFEQALTEIMYDLRVRGENIIIDLAEEGAKPEVTQLIARYYVRAARWMLQREIDSRLSGLEGI